jgi:hypothetical protein
MKSSDVIAKYKLRALGKFTRDFRPPSFGENLPLVKGIPRAFEVNIQRVHGIVVNGPYNVQFGTVGGTVFCSAAHEACNGRSVNWWDANDTDALLPDQIRIAKKKFPEHYAKITTFARTPPGERQFGGFSEFLFLKLLSVENQPVSHGFEASLAAALIGTWTAFEVLAGDLWEFVVNERIILAFIAMDAEPSRKDDPDTFDRKRKVTVPVLLDKLRDPEFNPHSRMGTLLRERREFEFTNRHEIRNAYLKIFPRNKEELRAILESKVVRWTSATRNALVHKAGLADKEFCDLVRDHPVLRKTGRDDRIHLDCEVMYELIQGIVDEATRLLKFVDSWMQSHAAKNVAARSKKTGRL